MSGSRAKSAIRSEQIRAFCQVFHFGDVRCLTSGVEIHLSLIQSPAMNPTVHLMLGLTGSGKTTFADQLARKLNLVCYSLDGEYFARVPNVQQEERNFTIEKEVEIEILTRLAAQLKNGESAVIDFCPWKRSQRQELYDFISGHGGIPHVYFLDVPKAVLLARLEARNIEKNATDQYVSPLMLDEFYQRFEGPGVDELVERIA